jgi:branched-chain amino acid transport system permease protein
MTWVNVVVQGVLLGGFYALLACGLSIMFGVMRIINLAHGDLAVLGAYLVWLLLAHLAVPPYAALVIVVPAMLAVGFVLQVGVLERSLRSGVLTPLLSTFGLSVVIQNLLLIAFSPDVRSLGGTAGAVTTASLRLPGDLSVPVLGLLILATAVLIVAGLQLYLDRTRGGAAWRAASQDPEVAGLVGIDARAVYATATAVAVAIAAVGGLFLAIRSTFDPASGPTQLIFAFEAVVIGGLGSLRGTLVGGVVLGVAQAVGAQLNPQYAVLAGHVVFLAVLASRGGALRALLGRRWAAS